MEFDELLAQVIALLQRQGRVSYGALKRRFKLDDDYLEDLKVELIEAQGLAADEQGRILVWLGSPAAAPRPTAPVRGTAEAPLAYTPPYLTEKILASRAALEGERKQVTVLFADTKGSMELIQGLDPEDARRLLDPAIHQMMDAVHRYEGTVNQVLGDGIMALFGAPLAHEDHALRACYAALAMQAAMRDYTEAMRRTQGLEVRIRVGLNSGEVAARMEQLAAPGSILLTAATLRLVEGLVRVNTLGPVPVKGLADAVEVFELVGASAIRRRLQASVARGLTRFVGRETELAAFQQAFEQAHAGHGQVVAVVGEAGIGKSRLAYECVHSHRTQGWRVLESASVSYGKATPYFPVIDLLKRHAHVEEQDDPRTIRAKVTGLIMTLDEALQDAIPALLSLLEALPADSPFLALDPPQRRQRTLTALKCVLLCESQVQPLLLVFEDLHWIDAETQALLESLMEGLPTARLLLLVNYRPEYQHGWGSKTYYTQLRLDPLPPASAEELLQALLGDDPSLASLKQLLIARTEGNPFFLEESVRTLVETGMLVGVRGAYRLAQALPSIQVPATVQAVLAARIDRLPDEEKRLLQTAAVVGTEVPLPLLEAIAELPEATLHHSLAHLQAAEFLYETRVFPKREYTFKHALTHEVAYGSLLQERRRTLHTRIVEAIERLYPDRAADQVERLAHHAIRGEVWDKALHYCRQAGTKAAEYSAHREAVTSFEQALGALQYLPESRGTCEQAIDIRLDLRTVLFALGEFERTRDILHQAEILAEALGDQHRLGRVATFTSQHFWLVGDHERAIASSQRALALAEALGDRGLHIMATFNLGRAYHDLGDYRRAVGFLMSSVESLEGSLLRERFGQAYLPSVFSRAWLALCLAEEGAFVEGIVVGEEAVRMAETVDHPFSRIGAATGVGYLYLRKGDLHQAISLLEDALGLSQDVNTPGWFPIIASALSVAYALSGRVAEALTLLERAVKQGAMRLISHHAIRVVLFSEAYLLAGRMEDAISLAQHALEQSRAYKERGCQAWALWLLGEIAVHREPPESTLAEAHYRQALDLAEELGMRPLMAHCHLALGKLYAIIGRHAEARAALSAAVELYRAMEMTLWLPQAEAALAEVIES
jgi:class 3 adenylate cyclase/tetratricopeptide (TPR) repeat protein